MALEISIRKLKSSDATASFQCAHSHSIGISRNGAHQEVHRQNRWRRELVGETESGLQRRSTRCRDHASINDKISTSCKAAAIAGEEEACRGDVLRSPSALKRDTTGSVADSPREVEDLIAHF